MPWPTVPVVTTGMDADTDTLPRADILDHTNKFNQLIAMRGVADGVCDLDSTNKIPTARLPGALSTLTSTQATDLAGVSAFMGAHLNDADAPTAKATLQILVSGTATTASGTVVDFTGIPAGTKRINICLDSVSTNGTSNILIQVGDSGGIETTGYRSGASNNGSQVGSLNGFLVTATMAASYAADGLYTLVLLNSSTNNWVGGGDVVTNASTGDAHSGGGAKSLSATLDRIRITTVNGTDTFDSGTINIIYE